MSYNLIALITLQQIDNHQCISSAATISPSTKNVFAFENHVISCVFDDIPTQITGVTWSPATETADQYTLADGSESSNSQTSTLLIYAEKLDSLDGVHTFTCSYAFGATNFAVTATQTITIFNPSNVIFQKNHD